MRPNKYRNMAYLAKEIMRMKGYEDVKITVEPTAFLVSAWMAGTDIEIWEHVPKTNAALSNWVGKLLDCNTPAIDLPFTIEDAYR